jgi:hypothetical protein
MPNQSPTNANCLAQAEVFRNEAVYKIIYSDVDEKPGVLGISLKQMVGARGFEPPTPWSRTRCATRLRYAPTAESSTQEVRQGR